MCSSRSRMAARAFGPVALKGLSFRVELFTHPFVVAELSALATFVSTLPGPAQGPGVLLGVAAHAPGLLSVSCLCGFGLGVLGGCRGRLAARRCGHRAGHPFALDGESRCQDGSCPLVTGDEEVRRSCVFLLRVEAIRADGDSQSRVQVRHTHPFRQADCDHVCARGRLWR